jgi:actin related protein 2/3 complex subunit 1A/1B
MFAARVTKGVTSPGGVGEAAGDSGDWRKHQGAITCIQAMARSPCGDVSKFSTSGVDGRLVIWNVAEMRHLPAAALGQ